MNAPVLKRLRCAVYTRKSTEEGLDQEYTSIDAQRDAGQAYIASRRSEGWIPVVDDYDDGGFSGGSLDRPALQRLLADIAAGKIDVVVAYKLDRLSRSLFDFAELVKLLDRHGVTFVSVTQQFNTTDAMGRMLLNILLTFAQFERELTAERIRDKFVASKKKGLWMQGIPPLGYDIVNRRLAIHPDEAEKVRTIFRRFVELGSILRVVRDVRERGWTGKSWTSRSGIHRPGRPHGASTIHAILHNRVYLGESKHRDQYFPDTHPPIIDRALWDEVQALLQVNGHVRGNTTRAKVDFLLKGLVFGPDGRALTPWHTKKGGRTYRYYLGTRAIHEAATDALRLPAAELETAVVAQIRRVMRTPEMVATVIPQAMALDSTLDQAQVTVALTETEAIWEQLFPVEQQRLVRLLVQKVVVTPTALEIRLQPCGIRTLATEYEREAA